jgi:CheY-like chemotaxis protein
LPKKSAAMRLPRQERGIILGSQHHGAHRDAMPRHPLVLIVDYDPRNIAALRELLTSNGYFVETATDGMAAIGVFMETRPDIVLLEAMIPKKHGFEVCQELKKTPEGKTTPVVIMTAVYKGRKYRTQAMHVHGCDEYVEKPCPPETLLDIVTRFVPPGKPATQEGASGRSGRAGQSAGKGGEVIQFPGAWPARAAGAGDDEDVEREITSRLDELLTDPSVFDDREANTEVAALAATSGAPLEMELNLDLDVEPPDVAPPRPANADVRIDEEDQATEPRPQTQPTPPSSARTVAGPKPPARKGSAQGHRLDTPGKQKPPLVIVDPIATEAKPAVSTRLLIGIVIAGAIVIVVSYWVVPLLL